LLTLNVPLQIGKCTPRAGLLNPFLPQHPFWSGPKQSSTPYHWLTHGYYKDEERQVQYIIFLLPLTATYVTFPTTL